MRIFAVKSYRYPPHKTAFGEDLNYILGRLLADFAIILAESAFLGIVIVNIIMLIMIIFIFRWTYTVCLLECV